MENKQTTTPKKTEQEVNVMDLLRYLLHNWKWYALSLAVCLGVAYYSYIHSPRTYYSSIDVLIDNPSNAGGVVGMDRYSSVYNAVNVSNEMHQLRSIDLLARMVRETGADMKYTIRVQLYQEDLYGREPVNIEFDNKSDNFGTSFTMYIRDSTHVELSDFYEDSPTVIVPIGKRVKTPVGVMRITLTGRFDNTWIDLKTQVTKYPVSVMAGYYHNAVSISQDDETASIIMLSLKDSSPLRAQAVLKGIIKAYNDDAKERKLEVADNTADFINERIAIISQELSSVENEMAHFKTSNRMSNPNQVAERYMEESMGYDNQLYDLEVELRMANSLRDFFVNPSNANKLIPTNLLMTGAAGLNTQITKINSLQQQYDRLGGEMSEGNPIVNEVKESILTERSNLLDLLNNYIRELDVKRDNVMRRGMRASSKIGLMPAKETEMLSIERQQKLKDALYTFLLNKREENALAQSMVADNARIIDLNKNSGSVSPNRMKIMSLGLLAGLLLPTLVLLSRLFLDTRVRSRRDLEGVVSVPFLGEVPFDEGIQLGNVFKSDDSGHKIVTEAIRVLRTNISFMKKDKTGAQVIMLTSFHEHSGKTFISVNLAKSLAQVDKRVLLIDMDIRKRSLTHLLDIHNHAGVSDYLASHADLDDVIIRISDDLSADFIPAGHVAPNPSELLMKPRLEELVAQVSSRYDYVLIDNVPIGGIADAKIVNRVADLTVFIIRSGNIDRRQLPEVERLYQENTLKNMALVLNGSSLKPAYGYGYGYTAEEQKQRHHHHHHKSDNFWKRLFRKSKSKK